MFFWFFWFWGVQPRVSQNCFFCFCFLKLFLVLFGFFLCVFYHLCIFISVFWFWLWHWCIYLIFMKMYGKPKPRPHGGWSWGLGFGFPKILGKCFSGSPSPYKHTYLFLLSLYMNKYIMYSWVRIILLFWKQQSVIQMVLNKIIRKEAGHKSGRFNNCPLDLCL